MISDVSSTERRLRDVGESASDGAERLRLGDVLDEHGRLRRFAHRPDDLLVAGVADQDDRVAVGGVAARLHVDLRHERRVASITLCPSWADAAFRRQCDAVGEVDDRRPRRASSSESTKIAPRSSRSRTTWMLWTICLRT